jgi:hypothetical protein
MSLRRGARRRARCGFKGAVPAERDLQRSASNTTVTREPRSYVGGPHPASWSVAERETALQLETPSNQRGCWPL